jgi:hypothetical protein
VVIPPSMTKGWPPGHQEDHPKHAPASANKSPSTGLSSAHTLTLVPSSQLYRIADLPLSLARNIVIDPETGEWIWTGLLDRDGYGRYSGEGVHRVVYKLLIGAIPAGLQIDHVQAWGCTSRACCSPWHLEAVTSRENSLRSNSFAAINAAKTECLNGHEFDLYTTYYRPVGHRDCRICIRARVKKYRCRRREAAKTGYMLAVTSSAEGRRAA